MLASGLDPYDKSHRVANFQQETLQSVREILAATGTSHPSKLNRAHLYRRISATEIKSYEEIFPQRAIGADLGKMPADKKVAS